MTVLVCLGLGYCARFHAAEFGSRFERIFGTSRSPDKATPSGIELLAFGDRRAVRGAIAAASHLLISAAPEEAGDPVLAAFTDAISAAPALQSIVYLSTTGVYGDHGGAWIDETAQTIPPHTRGAARVGGIYGPGQNAFVRLLAGRAHRIDMPGHVSNRIHVADIAQAIDAAFARGFDGIINVTDGTPASPGEQIGFAAKLLGIAPPPLLSLDEARRTLSPFLLSFYDGCARVRNDRLKGTLGITLRYPDYRAGLQALLDDGFEAR
jgi:nucleoside-diphosphate-sugar epimerase